jgi:hypothetical protein
MRIKKGEEMNSSMLEDLSEEECTKILLAGLKHNNPELRVTEVYENDTLIYAQVYDQENSNLVFEVKVKGFENLDIRR